MKKLYIKITLLIILVLVIASSCNKESIVPGNYELGSIESYTTTNEIIYNSGGTLPTWVNGSSTDSSSIVDTRWVLWKLNNGFANTYPNDTINFISTTYYELNSNNNTRNYNLTSNVASTNKTLTLYYFAPFGGSHYSGEIGFFSVEDGEINAAEFKNIQNTTMTIRAWFRKT
jgi:hypothetical protein